MPETTKPGLRARIAAMWRHPGVRRDLTVLIVTPPVVTAIVFAAAGLADTAGWRVSPAALALALLTTVAVLLELHARRDETQED